MPEPPAAVTLDIDETCDLVQGHQQLSLSNAHRDEHCFLPMRAQHTATFRPVGVLLRPGKAQPGREVRGPDHQFHLRAAERRRAPRRGRPHPPSRAAVTLAARRTTRRHAAAHIEATTPGLDIRFVVTNRPRGSPEWVYDGSAAPHCSRRRLRTADARPRRVRQHPAAADQDRRSLHRSSQPRMNRLRRMPAGRPVPQPPRCLGALTAGANAPTSRGLRPQTPAHGRATSRLKAHIVPARPDTAASSLRIRRIAPAGARPPGYPAAAAARTASNIRFQVGETRISLTHTCGGKVAT